MGIVRERRMGDISAWGEERKQRQGRASELELWGWRHGALSGWKERILDNV